MLGEVDAVNRQQQKILTLDMGERRMIDNALALASLCPPDAKTFETLIHGYLRYNQAEQAMAVLKEGARRLGGGGGRTNNMYQHFNQQLVQQVLLLANSSV